MPGNPLVLEAPQERRAIRAENVAFGTLLVPGVVLGALCYLAGVKTIGLVAAGIGFLSASMVAPSIALYAYFAIQALDVGLQSEQIAGFTPSKALAPFVLLLFLTRFGARFPRLEISRPLVWAALMLGAFGVLTAPFAIDVRVAAKSGAQIVVQVLLLVVAVKLLAQRVQIHRAFLATVAGGVVAALILVVTGGLSSRFSRATLGELANPNSVAHGLAVSLLAIPAAWGYTRSALLRLGYFAAAPLIVAGLMKTGSRSALAAVVAAFAIGGLVAKKAGIMRSIAVTAMASLVACASIVVVLHAGLLDPATQQRIEDFVLGRRGDVGEERGYIWRQSLREYARRPLVGFGFGNTAASLEESQGTYIDVHSSFVGPFVEGGPIGFTLFLLTLYFTFRLVRSIRQANPGIAAAMIFCMLLMSCLTHTIHFAKWFWIPITFCVLLAEQTHRERAQAYRDDDLALQ